MRRIFLFSAIFLAVVGCSRPPVEAPAQVSAPAADTAPANAPATPAASTPPPAQTAPAQPVPAKAPDKCAIDYSLSDSQRGLQVEQFTADLNQKVAASSPQEVVKTLGECWTLKTVDGSKTAIVTISHVSNYPGYGALVVAQSKGWKAYPLTRMPPPGDKAMPYWLTPLRAMDTPKGVQLLVRAQMPGSGGYGSMELLLAGESLTRLQAFANTTAQELGGGRYILSAEVVKDPADMGYANCCTPRWQQTLYAWDEKDYTYKQTAQRLVPSPQRTVTWFAGYLSKGDEKSARTLAASDAIVTQAALIYKNMGLPPERLVFPAPKLPEGLGDEYRAWDAIPQDLRGPVPPDGAKVSWPFGTSTLTVERVKGEWLITGIIK